MTTPITRTAAADVINAWPMSTSCPRARAHAVGTLVPTNPGIAAEVGWHYPVSCTAAVHRNWIAWNESVEAAKRRPTGQDQDTREWDVLYMARAAVRRCPEDIPAWTFTLCAVPSAGPDVVLEDTRLSVHLGLGDSGEPVVTITEAEHE